MDDIDSMLRRLIESGMIPPELVQMLRKAQESPDLMNHLLEKLAPIVGSAAQDTLDPESYYQDGDGSKFTTLWPLSNDNPVVIRGYRFDDLDRKTQFQVLFAEWSRRESDGLMALAAGDFEGAEATFRECVERGTQIQVAELRARSYEDLARVAERRGDQAGVLHWLDQAEGARAEG